MAITEAKVEDERGRRVPVVRELEPAPRWPWKKPPWRLLGPDARCWMYVEGSAGLGVIALAIVMSIIVAMASSQRVTTVGIVMLLGAMGLYVLINQLHNWHWSGPGRRYAARVYAAQGTCPSCGYNIAGLPRGEDGLTTCPECASAWRVG